MYAFSFCEPVGLLVEPDKHLKLTFYPSRVGSSVAIEALNKIAHTLLEQGQCMLQVSTPEAKFWADKLGEVEIWNGLKLVNQYSPTLQHSFHIPGPLTLKIEGDAFWLNLTFIKCRKSCVLEKRVRWR